MTGLAGAGNHIRPYFDGEAWPKQCWTESLAACHAPNSDARPSLLPSFRLRFPPLPPPTSRSANPRYISPWERCASLSTNSHTDCHCMPRCFPPTVHGNAAKPIWRKNGGQAGSVHHSAHRTRPGLGSSAPVLQCSSAAASCHLLCSSVHLLLATPCSSSLLLCRAYKGSSVLLN